MKYKKWRELIEDPYKIPFNNFILKSIINYLPAGNDVVECIVYIDGEEKNVFLKVERSKMADFDSEFLSLKKLVDNNYYNKVPIIIDSGVYNLKKYLVLSKIEGKRLSEIFNNCSFDKREKYLFKYGRELAIIHKIPCHEFSEAKQRIINDIPKKEHYNNFDDFINECILFLEKEKPNIIMDTFIHGDFHYANILWKYGKVNGVIDFEYSGRGFKEQDIAWALVLRPGQKFMDNYNDLKMFLDGYKTIGDYDSKTLGWCLINAICHFYLMNYNNVAYREQIKSIVEFVFDNKL